MTEEKTNKVSSPAGMPKETLTQKEPSVPSPEVAGISEAERQKIIAEERQRVKEEEKLKESAVKSYKKENKKGIGFFKLLLVLLVLVVAVVAGGYITFSAYGMQSAWGQNYPYVATYDVLLPDSSELIFGNVQVLAVSAGDEVTLKIGNERQILTKGIPAEYQPAHITVKTYGVTLRESDYRLTVTYRGLVENRLDFLITARTSAPPMSSWMTGFIVPSRATVRPV
ncbi:MAG: hypothetical protein GX097_07720 [Methanomicrobiales archaeon]|nr:hypothetical protein [Methanomicrobiales archaeon]